MDLLRLEKEALGLLNLRRGRALLRFSTRRSIDRRGRGVRGRVPRRLSVSTSFPGFTPLMLAGGLAFGNRT